MGASVHQELANYVEAGLTPLEALRAATIAPAIMMGLEREQGTVEVGMRADLLLLAGNPLEDIRHAANRVGLLLGGRWFVGSDLEGLAQDFSRTN
jgi:imidazolonepropionase-like amidohydrolase